MSCHHDSYHPGCGYCESTRKPPHACTWSVPVYLAPDHNGTTYQWCTGCGVMRLSPDSLKFMNANNPKMQSS